MGAVFERPPADRLILGEFRGAGDFGGEIPWITPFPKGCSFKGYGILARLDLKDQETAAAENVLSMEPDFPLTLQVS